MSSLRIASRVTLLLGVFLIVGFATSRALIHHAVARGVPEYDVRLAGYMGGLFCGAVAAAAAGLALFIGRKRNS